MKTEDTSKYKHGLTRTRESLGAKLAGLFNRNREINEDLYEELEETLILADVGVKTTTWMISELRSRVKDKKIKDTNSVKDELKSIFLDLFESDTPMDMQYPAVLLIVGVNGAGKTTAIAKLSAMFKSRGKSVLLAAGDTFRAAASEQLETWAGRAGVPLIKHGEGADPAAVIFDAVKSAQAKKTDILICDTAGRLQNKAYLMEELKKINRVARREFPDACHKTLLVIDATTGQNALVQSQVFKESVEVDGIILTKLDGTSKGGAAAAITQELGVPIWYIGIGEGMQDLQTFNAHEFVDAII